jgi:hypothetical protein
VLHLAGPLLLGRQLVRQSAALFGCQPGRACHPCPGNQRAGQAGNGMVTMKMPTILPQYSDGSQIQDHTWGKNPPSEALSRKRSTRTLTGPPINANAADTRPQNIINWAIQRDAPHHDVFDGLVAGCGNGHLFILLLRAGLADRS